MLAAAAAQHRRGPARSVEPAHLGSPVGVRVPVLAGLRRRARGEPDRRGDAVLTGGRGAAFLFVQRPLPISEKAAAHKAGKVDRMRKKYFDFYSDTPWGEASSYDLMISSSRYGIAGTAGVITKAVQAEMAEVAGNE